MEIKSVTSSGNKIAFWFSEDKMEDVIAFQKLMKGKFESVEIKKCFEGESYEEWCVLVSD